jgi:ribosomal protein L7/L12
MPQTFTCPACGAPLQLDRDGDATVRCNHCGSTVIVPEQLRGPAQAAAPPALRPRDWSLAEMLQQAGQFGEVARLVQAGQKIEAIKLYRTLTGVGLKEAKDAIEQLEAGQVVSVGQLIVQQWTSGAGEPPDPAEIRRLLLAGKKIEAVKLYRQQTGLGLKEAKDAVEAVEAALGRAGPEPSVVVDTPQSPDVMVKLAEVRNRLAAGDKLEAIKRFRQHFGVGLQEARDAVEAMERGQPVPPWTLRPSPPATSRPAARAGRRTGWLAVLGLALGLAACIALSGSLPLMLSGSFSQAAEIATHDPQVIARLGSPVSVVWWRLVWGQMSCGSRCSSNYSFYVAGPKGDARVQVLSDSSGGFPFVGEGEWTPDLRYYFDEAGPGLAVAATETPQPPTATLSLAEIDATAGARARATRAVQQTATAEAQARLDATATVEAEATQAAALMQATAQAMIAEQAGWQTVVISETFDHNANFWPVERYDDGSLVLEPAITDGVYRWVVKPQSGGHYWNLLPGAVEPVDDFVVSTDIRLTGGEGGVYVYGLAFRAEGRDYGLFGLTNEGSVRIYGVFGSAIYHFYDFSSPAMHTEAGAVNRLTVRAIGPDFVFEINGEVVYTWNEPDLNDGRIGLGVDIGREGRDAVIEYDNFEVVAP